MSEMQGKKIIFFYLEGDWYAK